MYHCSNNMLLLNFLVSETVKIFFVNVVCLPFNLFALLINPGVMSGARWLLSTSPKRVSSLSNRMKFSAPSYVQILQSPAFSAIISKFPADKPLKKCTKAYRFDVQLGIPVYIYHIRQTCFALTTKQVDFLLLISHLSMICVFHHRGQFYMMNTLHCLDDG